MMCARSVCRVLLVTLAFNGLKSLAAAQEAPAADARRAEVIATMTAAMERHAVPGASIAVIDNYQLAWAEGLGLVAADRSAPVTPTTLFQAASISKPVTALAALRLVELGKLNLDEDVNPRLMSWHIPASQLMVGNPVTLRRLLSHSAGLNVHGFAGYPADATAPTLLQVLAGAPPANSAPIKLEIKPGYMYRYSGGGYSVVQLLLTEVTGAPFPELMRQQVLAPLQMTHSTYDQPLPANLAETAATGHRRDKKPIPGNWHVYPEMAAAGLWTTPSDLARVVMEVASAASGRSAKLLSGQMATQMLTVQRGSYGLGFALKGEGRSLAFSHGGSNEGFRCLLVGMPATGQGVVIMTNSDTGSPLLPDVLAVVSRVYAWPVQ